MEQEELHYHYHYHYRNPPTTVIALNARLPIPDHPPYAEMVQMALRSLSDPGGSTESAISNYIVASYADLPPGHARLLPYYINKLVAAGDIAASSPGRYLLPPPPRPNTDPNANPRRRGRPPKNKPRPPCRGRGRPRKNPEMASRPAPTRPRFVIRLRRKKPNSEVGDRSGGAPATWALVGCGSDGEEESGGNGELNKSKKEQFEPFEQMPLSKPFEPEF
ncbi:uncharacterized protein [Typha angustifolia]|uniref:uncharacterized protein n=1 Tax=Typha angustifolia TaxID=59011 RepID=UPI003C2D227C